MFNTVKSLNLLTLRSQFNFGNDTVGHVFNH